MPSGRPLWRRSIFSWKRTRRHILNETRDIHGARSRRRAGDKGAPDILPCGRKCVAVDGKFFAGGLAKRLLKLSVLLLGIQIITNSCGAARQEAEGREGIGAAMLRSLAGEAEDMLYRQFLPALALQGGGSHWFWQEQIDTLFPFYGYLSQSASEQDGAAVDFRTIMLAEAEEGASGSGLWEDGAPESGQWEDGVSGSGQREDGVSGGGQWKDGASESGLWEDGMSGAGPREDGASGSGQREDGDSGAGQWKDGDSGAGQKEDGISGSGPREDGTSGNGQGKGGASGGGQWENGASGAGTGAEEARGQDAAQTGQDGAADSRFPAEGSGAETLQELLRAENEAALQMQISSFAPHEMQAEVSLGPLGDYGTLVRQFYSIDANTMAGGDQLNVEKLLGMDMAISKDAPGPQILIYHTHSQEAFADSRPGEEADTIMGAGDRLAEILTQNYGYEVLHHRGQYDVKSRDDAYSNALTDIEQVLKENPSIQVVIDLHRDEMPEGVRLVMDLDGRPTARFMFFNGLSRTRKTGNIAYLYNENLEGNLAFSFQMQLKAMEYYPGLTRKIYLKGYRYNMHLRPRCLLVELGAQNNTVEEAMNACDPLAHILDLVLSGE